jgi:hypothetical protein
MQTLRPPVVSITLVHLVVDPVMTAFVIGQQDPIFSKA